MCNAWSQSANTVITGGIAGLALSQLNPNSSYFYNLACFLPLGTFKCFTSYFNVAPQPAWHKGEFSLALRLLCSPSFACPCWTWRVWKSPLTFASVGWTQWSKTGREQHQSTTEPKTTRASGCSSEGFLNSTDRNVSCKDTWNRRV